MKANNACTKKKHFFKKTSSATKLISKPANKMLNLPEMVCVKLQSGKIKYSPLALDLNYKSS